jgi:hypothetical protein
MHGGGMVEWWNVKEKKDMKLISVKGNKISI